MMEDFRSLSHSRAFSRRRLRIRLCPAAEVDLAMELSTGSCLLPSSLSLGEKMPKYKDEVPTVRVYTVCDESKYLIVRNFPVFGCGDELLNLFSTYGKVEECKPMDDEECESFCLLD